MTIRHGLALLLVSLAFTVVSCERREIQTPESTVAISEIDATPKREVQHEERKPGDQKEAGKRYALIVGINEYANNNFAPLKYTENDAEGLATTLDGYDVVVMTSSRAKTKRELEPTAKNIRTQLEKLLAKKTRHDTILIAFAGHGLQLEVTDPEDKGPSKTFPMFCPSDAQLNDTKYRTGKSPTLINMDQLLEEVGDCGAGTKMLFIDACRNEVRGRNVTASTVKIPKGVAVLFSCSEGQRAFETPKLGRGHGVFFHHVIAALKDGDSVIWTDLTRRVIDKVEKDVPRLIGDGAKQEPHEVRSGGRAPIIIERDKAERLFRQGLDAWHGVSGEIDEVGALKLFDQARKLGHALATAEFGLMHYHGQGTDVDQAKALELIQSVLPALRKRAEHDIEAMTVLASLYQAGLGVEKDEKEAVRWFRQAAAKDHKGAMDCLGWVHVYGRGVERDDKEAVGWFRKSVELDYPFAMYSMGWAHDNGVGVERDYKEAQRWFRKAADRGHPAAMTSLGWMALEGKGVPKDDKECLKRFKTAAELGDPGAMNGMGWLYEFGRGVEKDYAQSVDWYRKAVKKADPFAMNSLGGMYAYGRGVKQDDAQALNLFRQASSLGNSRAMSNLGWMYANGRGVQKDDKVAAGWFKQAADLGDGFAMSNLGDLHFEGRGVKQDHAEAVRWYEEAAKRNQPRAMTNLGRMYETGQGVKQDLAKAVTWYDKAAVRGDVVAMSNLGKMYADGRGVKQDPDKAVHWYLKAVEKDFPRAMSHLGWMYETGRGLPRNRTEAFKWYKRAAALGDDDARKAVARLEAKK